MKQKLPTWARVTSFFAGLLLSFLMAGLLFHWPLLVRVIIAAILGLITGIGSYGVIPTKRNLDEIRAGFRKLGKYDDADGVGAKDWIAWVLVSVGICVIAQFLASWLE